MGLMQPLIDLQKLRWLGDGKLEQFYQVWVEMCSRVPQTAEFEPYLRETLYAQVKHSRKLAKKLETFEEARTHPEPNSRSYYYSHAFLLEALRAQWTYERDHRRMLQGLKPITRLEDTLSNPNPKKQTNGTGKVAVAQQSEHQV